MIAAVLLALLFPIWIGATPAPKAGEALGSTEFSITYPTSEARGDRLYSEGLGLSISSTRFLPIHLGLNFGFLNENKQRFTQFNLLGFGRQAAPRGQLDYFLRADLVSLIWSESDGIWFSPGVEIGLLIPVVRNYGIALSGKLSAGRAAKENSPTFPLIGINFGWVRGNVHSPDGN